VTNVAPSSKPLWGAKVATFINRERAERTAEFLRERGIEVDLLSMGGEVEWGEAGELDTTVTAVVIGRLESIETVLERAREQLLAIPAEDSRIVAGLRRYDDEIPRLEAVRLNPPVGGQILIQREDGTISATVSSPLICTPNDPSKQFELADVTIGIQFHWQHDETLAFCGALEIVADEDRLTAVNEVDLDDYLASLLGSEMRLDWPDEALAAQAIAARSTVLATRSRHHYGEAYQLCHDDHCQCYQGVSRESETSRRILESVRGQVLTYDGRVADARYAKTSGVLTDAHEIAWDDEIIPYLTPVPCGPSEGRYQDEVKKAMTRSGEENLREWLANPPEWSACNPASHPYPPSAEEMKDLFIWREELSWDRVTELVKLRTGVDIGEIHHLEPLERGISGRIVYLRVHGSEGTITLGKELTIRRLLSDSHLPSSAFIVSEKNEGIALDGLGWGHGVGLCQLGACGLAAKGWDRVRILDIFYPGARLQSGGSTVDH
ncbi:MAG TPA: SpoIID/LytB domain-containing protein, partial [Bacteroidetes bacterium]|nr:SpoIID/LytB domain-containing protein [Bacteroidota bacterium]HEX04088.1 SpoIID/LytB domain-containing protein [Bacteroidota bacterium]